MINYPNSPVVGEQFSINNKTFEWDGEKWRVLPVFGVLPSGVVSYETTLELETSIPVLTGQRAENRETGESQYVLTDAGYTAKDGDIVAANGRVWKLTGGSYNATLTVNTPSDFATMQEAVDFYHNNVTFTNGAGLILNIESGHQPASGVSVSNGDYSYITITSIAEVTVSAAFGTSASFVQGDNAKMPKLDCLVNGNLGSLGFGYRCENNSEGYITTGSGVKFCWQDGLAVRYGSRCFAENTVWTNNAQNGTTSSGIVSWSSMTHAEGANASDSGYYGAQAAHGGVLNFQNGIANNCTRYGMRASDGALLNADSATANNCGLEGLRAFNGCQVNFRSGTATGSGANNISASGSVVDAATSTLTGSLGHGVLATGSVVRLDGANVSNSAQNGVESLSSKVSCQSIIASNCATGINADDCSQIEAAALVANGCTLNGVSALNGSTVNAKNANLDSCAQYGANAWWGSRINMDGATARLAGSRGVYAFSGSTINAKGVDARKVNGVDTVGSSADITCLEGSVINAATAVGGVNKTVNTINNNGVIYQ